MFGVWDLVVLGLGERAIQQRGRTGRLHRMYRGVYSIVDPRLLTRRGHWRAALLAYGSEAILFSSSAGALWGIRPSNGGVIHVAVPGQSAQSRPGINAHCGRSLAPGDIDDAEGIRCTTVARTLLALAARGDEQALRASFKRAEVLRIFDGREVDALLLRSAGLPGAPLLRRVHGDAREDGTKNPFEASLLQFCERMRLAKPEVNVWLRIEERDIEADFLWRRQRVILETDGWETHGTRTAFHNDRRRDQLLLRNGWQPIRATTRHLDDELARTLRAVLA